jgi:putative DNA methylase
MTIKRWEEAKKSLKNAKTPAWPACKPGQQLTVIAWLWARTVKSPNPAFSHVEVPLVSTFILSSKAGKEAWVAPVVEGDGYRFEVRTGTPPAEAKAGTTAGKRAPTFRCLMSGAPIDYKYIRGRGRCRTHGRTADGHRGRRRAGAHLPGRLLPTHEAIAESAKPCLVAGNGFAQQPAQLQDPNYGLTKYGDLFTPRQLVALTTFSDLVPEAIARIRADALAAGMADDGRGLDAGGNGATAYAEAVGVYLSAALVRRQLIGLQFVLWHSAIEAG